MPTRIRRRFEAAMAADLSDVRVHRGGESDDLNAALGSRAFTSGSHVFFGGGLPDLESPSGQHVMAHELAHVVQNDAAVGRIRRAVGFEFEVGSWTVERIDRSLSWRETSGRDPIPTADVDSYAGDIDTAGPWSFTGDQSADGTTHIEWVMQRPVEETDAGRVELAKRMDLIERVNDDFIAKGKKAPIVRSHEENGGMLTKRYRGQHVGMPKNVLVEPFAEMRGEPQMTAGIALDRIVRVMENVGKDRQKSESRARHDDRSRGNAVLMGKGQAERPVVSESPAAVRAAFAKVSHTGRSAPTEPSRELIGVVSLLRSYLIGASNKKTYAKGIAPLLVKTDFAKLFSMLPEAAYYRKNDFVWMELVLTSAGMTLGDRLTPLFSGGVSYAGPDLGALQTITKRDWLRGIAVDGVDMITVENIKKGKLAHLATHLFGFGSLGDATDTVGPTGEETDRSAIIEFRRIRGGLPHDRWKDAALALFDYVRQINAHEKGKYTGEGWYD